MWSIPKFLCFADYYSNTLFKFDIKSNGTERIESPALNLKCHKTVQVFDDLYTVSSYPLAIFKYENITQWTGKTALVKHHLAEADHDRLHFALSNYKNRALYITGGITDSCTKSAVVYNLSSDKFT